MCRKFPFIITGLFSIILADGKLGWVQPVGENPKDVTSDMTEAYGVGAFLLAGTEMLKLTETLHHD
jgi:unsaturated rhamnogalacturonyl hydrolase